MQSNHSIRNSFLLLITAMIWGFAFVAQSVGMKYVGPFTFTCVRSLIGALVLLPFIFYSEKHGRKDRETDPQERRLLLKGGILCGLLLCLASNFQQFGIKFTTVGKAGFITALYIVLVPLAGLLLGKKSSPFIWAAVLLALCGLYLLCITDGFTIQIGDLLVIVCAFIFTFQILTIDHYAPLVSGVRLSCIQFVVCGILSGIPALLLEHPDITSLLAAWKPVLYAGVLSSGVGYTLQIIGQKELNPTVASLIMSLESCFSAIAGYLVLNQKMTVREIIGCVIMFAAIVLAQLPFKPYASSGNTP